MKNLLISISLICVAGLVEAQELIVMTGFSTAQMKDMKVMQKSFEDDFYYVDLEATESFPAYWQHAVMYRMDFLDNYTWGVRLFTTSTGGRMTYQDYSGQATFDQALKCTGLMGHFAYRPFETTKSRVSLYLDLGAIASQLDYRSFVQIGSQSQTEAFTLASLNLSCEAGVDYTYWLLTRWLVNARLGYQQDAVGGLQNEDGATLSMGDDILGANWSGLKFQVGIGFRFHM